MQSGYTILSKNDFDNFLEKYKEKRDIIGRTFFSGTVFEPNFMTYFPNFPKQFIQPFLIYHDKIDKESKEPNRKNFMEKIKKSEVGKKYRYFGHSGIGKSTGLICALKYDLKPNNGSLYINLKAMRKLIEAKNFNKIKQIFIDESIFLFHDDYNNYSVVSNAIKNFDFSSVWQLIEFVLDLIKNMDSKRFIIVFDEYKKKNDLNNAFEPLCKKFLEGSKIFSFVRVSPQNDNPDIRKDFIEKIKHFNDYPDVFILTPFRMDLSNENQS